MAKITYEDKVGIIPRTVHINQVWDDDMTEIKDVVNGLDFSVNEIGAGNFQPIFVSAIWNSGLIFDCTADSYPINNIYYSAPAVQLTLSVSDATLDRIDLIVAKIPVDPAVVGTIQIIEGTLATTALVVPPDYDASTYFVIKQILVKANATTPDGTFSTEVVYADGTEQPNEWDFSSSAASIVNSGGIIDATNPVAGDKATMMNDITVAGLNSDKEFSLSFDITLKSNPTDNYQIVIKLLDSTGHIITHPKYIPNNTYGFDRADTAKQTIIINGRDFVFTNIADVWGIQIYPYLTFTGYELDNINFNVGSDILPLPGSIPTKTSDLTNDGSDTLNPFISLADLPPSLNPTALSYSVIWTETGLIFDCLASNYFIVDTYYSATPNQITLDAADGSNDRIDLIVANTSGVITKITGTPAPSPAEPNYDLATEFPMKFILVAASATEPSGIANILVYDENLGSGGGEWDSVSTIVGQPYSGVVGDYASTDEAHSGTKSTKLRAGPGFRDYASWSDSTGISISDINTITFWIKFPTDMSFESNFRSIIVLSPDEVLTGTDPWGFTAIGSGDGIDLTSTAWQQYTIPFGALKNIDENFYGIGFTMKSFNLIIATNSNISFYIDEVEIQTDTDAPPPPPTTIEYAPLSHVTDFNNPHQVDENVATNLSEGTTTDTTVDVNSSDGTNATLVAASTSRAGIMTKAKFDEVVVNNYKVTNATHTGEVTGNGSLTINTTAISNKTLKSTLAGTEEILINDAGTLKKTTSQDIADLGGGGGGGALIAYKTIDETKTNDITLAADTDLQISLDASSTYSIRCVIFQNSHTTPDFKSQFAIPSGAILRYFIDEDTVGATTYDETFILITGGASVEEGTSYIGYITTTTAGIFSFNWSQNVSAADATTLKKGSFLIVTKLN